ncbi:MAG: hypothetical protein M1831_005586 [Alyxoria varia]|nr:MAG: hypothetical protein M1831_005586 [Alyxoria varia]
MTSSSPEAKKRKAIATEEELAIDVAAPEPPSKKARRKAKKHRTKAIEEPATNSEAVATNAAKQNAPSSTDQPDSDDDNSTGAAAKATTTSKSTSQYSIWIGNLPFAINKSSLLRFLTTTEPASSSTSTVIPSDSITRIHLPSPHPAAIAAAASRSAIKPMNKGFAYVDLADEESFKAALGLSETSFGSRNILIKDARDFSGRPAEHGAAPKDADTQNGEGADGKKTKGAHDRTTATRRVWVGNLGFGVTEHDFRDLYGERGGLQVEDVKLATFEDSGKCKGFGWVIFADSEDAAGAVRGFVHVAHGGNEDGEEVEADEQEVEGDITKNGKKKKEKIFINRLQGRDLRREFAEDPTTRYNKRFGKNKQKQDDQPSGRYNVKSDAHDRMKTKKGQAGDVEGEGNATMESQREDESAVAGEKKQRRDEWDAGAGNGQVGTGRRDKYANDPLKYRTGAIARSEGVKTALS